eukprot:6373454-Ditylum_brightwellii.AAC.1
MTQDKIDITCTIMEHCHKGRRSFIALQAAQLIAKLEHAAQLCRWLRFLYFALCHSAYVVLKMSKHELQKSKPFQLLIKEADKMDSKGDDTHLKAKIFSQ